MTDKERLYTSKLYMEKLACGMNPFDGEELSEDSVLNDIHLCRTFTFVADILEQVIKNGGSVVRSQNLRKEPFRITEEQRKAITVSETEVNISTIVKRIMFVLDNNVKGIPSIAITRWLEAEGLLESVNKNGKFSRIATDEGNTLGISTRVTSYQDKTYIKTMYDLNAQIFIIANLENIVQFNRSANM